MTQPEPQRLPLTTKRAVSTFGIGVVGFMSANLVPFMILAIQDSLKVGATEAGTLMTACLLATALACLAVTRFTEGHGRYLVARLGLLLTAAGFGLAALDLAPAAVITGIIAGGIGAGGAVASGGAALAALRNPNRASGISGLANRAIVTVVLAVIPAVGIGMGSAFGFVAGLALALLFTAGWLPMAERGVAQEGAPHAPAESTTTAITPAGTVGTRTITIAGFALLSIFALWAIGEDSLWAMSGAIGVAQAGMTEEQLGLVLSASTGGGLLAAIALIFLGTRLGRALPLGILLALGAALKLTACLTTDSTTYLVTMIAWNTVYAVAFMYFIATAAALDASGRWSGPVLGVYLVGSSFAPMFGAWIGESFGFPALGWVLAGFSLVLLVPAVLIARLSSRVEAVNAAKTSNSPDIATIRTAGV
ncbi:DHA1 family inner membrane transport protein [Pseudarthrobacter sp. W1I19]|uniref:MFS transporter n=1 Tax=Pseudarthrobacter sp. W1I19 TaxID=3042288 RepID=UPI002787820E|nr:MFS transporter [Pseudarthrobacter sp. W1I19]MDQ0921934.1 DHA1 family inner membrane transport protein [Pseudarthrobacter sp. W1I19]